MPKHMLKQRPTGYLSMFVFDFFIKKTEAVKATP